MLKEINEIKLLKFALCNMLDSGNELCYDNRFLSSIDWSATFNFFNNHSIVALTSDVVQYIPDELSALKKSWKEAVYSNVFTYSRLVKQQSAILKEFEANKIPVVVIKGTSASKYYSKPQFRTMGDVDLLVKPVDYEKSVQCLEDAGSIEITSEYDASEGRHKSFSYNGIIIELHRSFAKRVEEKKGSYIDHLLFNSISGNATILPDVENGIVLLAHIRQHMEAGLGFRQIIDWMMFVNSYLDDNMWFSSFQEKSRLAGLELLALVTTKMCQKNLGLDTKNITWCDCADEAVCDDLMQYIMDCGNFGRSRGTLQSGKASQLPSMKHPIQLIKYIQALGETNWKAIKKHPYLKPFAWFYQSCHYVKLAIQNKVTPNKLKAIYDEGNKRNEMFAALGLK